MLVTVLTLRYDPARGALDDSALAAFASTHVIVRVRDHFYTVGNIPHLSLVIEYRPAVTAPPPSSGRAQRTMSAGQRRVAPTTDELRASLPTTARELFDRLRAWRSRIARDEVSPLMPSSPTPSSRTWRGTWMRSTLGLELKPSVTQVYRTATGVPFLGFRVSRRGQRIRRPTWRRLVARLRCAEWQHREGRRSAQDLAASVRSMLAHVSRADTRALRRKLLAASVVEA